MCNNMRFEKKLLSILKVNDKFGRLDVIINNAGIINDEGKLCDISLESYHRVVGVNQHGAWYTLK